MVPEITSLVDEVNSLTLTRGVAIAFTFNLTVGQEVRRRSLKSWGLRDSGTPISVVLQRKRQAVDTSAHQDRRSNPGGTDKAQSPNTTAPDTD